MRRTSAAAVLFALLMGGVTQAQAQGDVRGIAMPLSARLDSVEAFYDHGAVVVRRETADTVLARRIREFASDLRGQWTRDTMALGGRSDHLTRATQTYGQLVANLDQLAGLVGAASVGLPPTDSGSVELGTLSNDSTPLVTDITQRVWEALKPVLAGIDSTSRRTYDRAQRASRFTAFSHSYEDYRFIKERLLSVVGTMCRERDPLCERLEPARIGPNLILLATGYSRDVYGVGFLTVLPKARWYGHHRATLGGQVLTDFSAPEKVALEVSGGNMFGDFAVLPGVVISRRGRRAIGLSGALLYAPRGHFSIGASFATKYGLGVRVVYGFRPGGS